MKHLAAPLALVAGCALAPLAYAATLPATPATFVAVLGQAHAGDTIAGAAGTYPGLDYVFYNRSFSPAVTITSADPAHPAVLTHFDANNAKGLVFRDVALLADAPGYFRFNFYNCADIHFDHVSVHGSLDGDPQDDAEGLAFLGCDNIGVTNSEFQQLLRGLSIGSSSHVTVTGNEIHDIAVTGMAIGGGSSDVAITLNSLHDFFPVAGDHPDAIQFLTAGQTATTHDVQVTDNLIHRGRGGGTQGIFFRDQTTTQHYANVTVARNLIVGTGFGGIAMDYTDGLTVDGNVLVSFAPPADYTPLQVFNSSAVTVSNNSATVWGFDADAGLVQSGNVTTPGVTDLGVASMTAFAAAHPDLAAAIAKFLPAAPAPEPAPAPTPDPRDAEISQLQAQLAQAAETADQLKAGLAAVIGTAGRYATALQVEIVQGTAANAKRPGPTKADVAAMIGTARTALAAH